MTRTIFIATPLFFGLLFAGCWITWDDDCGSFPHDDCFTDRPGPGYDINDCAYWGTCDGPGSTPSPGETCVPGEIRYCDSPVYCSWGEQVCLSDGSGWGRCNEGSPPPGCDGYFFDPDCCVASGSCCQDWYDSDGDGDINDSIGTCEEVPTCSEDADCSDGYCAIEDGEDTGICRVTGGCATDDDCNSFGPGLICDERHVCIPEEAPCPSGDCGCDSDSECDDGLMCLNSRCTPPESVCFFDFECESDSLCLNNACHRRCACDVICPSGTTCQDGICLEPATGIDGCVFDEDCAASGARCINATCYASCSDDEECADGESCRGGACRANTNPSHECSDDASCSEGLSCHRGVCRLPCAADINCSGTMMSTCGPEGYCVSPIEVEHDCIRATDCADDESCLSNSCTTL